VNLDVKFIAGFTTRGTVTNAYVNTPGLPLFETAKVGTATMQVRVNPLIISLGTGMNF
jgi:hypothetical protein